eukprot:10043711-Karenia_brevis.AAC.1
MAAQEKGMAKPLAYRNGKTCLGVVGLTATPGKSTFMLRGAPEWWGPAAIQEFLQSHEYEEIEGMSPPRHKGQGWLFQAHTTVQKKETYA